MGWWNILEAENPEVWGDEPADTMCDALDEVIKAFEKEWNRKPTVFELEYGLSFSLGGLHLDEEE